MVLPRTLCRSFAFDFFIFIHNHLEFGHINDGVIFAVDFFIFIHNHLELGHIYDAVMCTGR